MSLKDEFGKVPLCNHRAERGLYVHGFCLPLCSRCTGILAGAAAGTLLFYAKRKGGDGRNREETVLKILSGIVCLLPTAMDGAAEYGAGRESDNRRRMGTGIMAGLGCAAIDSGIMSLIRDVARGKHF